jgi:phenylacetate-CoA ligase
MTTYFDALETRDPEEREAALMAKLPAQVALAQDKATGFGAILTGIDAATVIDRAALAKLPITRKSELMNLQRAVPPFGGLNATPTSALRRVFLSPGPIADPQGQGKDWFRMGRAIFAAGFRAGNMIQNCFSYHFTPAGAMFEDGAHAVGCTVFPAGVGQTDLQVEAIAHFRPDGYAGTPDFLKLILDKADAAGTDVSSLKRACVGGGALFPAMRDAYAARGIHVRQTYGSADCGLIAYESDAMEGMILDEHIILEIVRPGTGDPVPDGEVGEVIVTLINPDYPLIRFATGDLSAMMAGTSPCGRTAPRIKGWMGRADQTAKIRGMFVHPGQVDRVVKSVAGLNRARLIIDHRDGRDIAVLRCEAVNSQNALADRIASTFSAECKVRVNVEFTKPGELPNDGKIIDDIRQYD